MYKRQVITEVASGDADLALTGVIDAVGDDAIAEHLRHAHGGNLADLLGTAEGQNNNWIVVTEREIAVMAMSPDQLTPEGAGSAKYCWPLPVG